MEHDQPDQKQPERFANIATCVFRTKRTDVDAYQQAHPLTESAGMAKKKPGPAKGAQPQNAKKA